MRAGAKNHQCFFGCLKCTEESSKIHDRVGEVSLISIPWTPRTEGQYFEELFTHLVAIKVEHVADKKLLIDSFTFLIAYPWGRVVGQGKGARWGLVAGDRLVLSDLLLSIHDVELSTPPFEICFRPRKESGLQGISLMWDIPGVCGLTSP